MELKSTIKYPSSKFGVDQIQVSMVEMREERGLQIVQEA